MINIYETTYKNIFAVCLETTRFYAYFLPKNGCKLASLVDKSTNYEIMAQDISPEYIPQNIDSDYVKCEVSAFDDMFPTIDPVIIQGKVYPCHGEVCRVEHQYQITGNALETIYDSPNLLYSYKKRISATSDGAVNIDYEIKNNTNRSFSCLWAAHFMISAQKGGYGVTPYKKGAPVEIMFDSKSEYGAKGDILPLSKNIITSDSYAADGNTYKFYFTQKIPHGTCGYYIPSIEKTVTLCYDKNIIPYLGIWVNNGSFKNMHNFALEPCTAPYDSPVNAKERAAEFVIKAKDTLQFTLEINVR